jgi:hypothetical protein
MDRIVLVLLLGAYKENCKGPVFLKERVVS